MKKVARLLHLSHVKSSGIFMKSGIFYHHNFALQPHLKLDDSYKCSYYACVWSIFESQIRSYNGVTHPSIIEGVKNA